MAEATNWGERIAQVGRSLNPVTRVRNMFSGFRDHPMQTIGTGLLTLLGGAVAGPIGAQLGRAGSQYAFRQYNQSQAPDGLPGIIGPNTYDPANQAQTMANLLGIPNYAGGNSGFTNASQFLTGNFGPQQTGSGFQPIDLSYGQSQQQAPDASQAPLPGLGSPMGSYGASSGPRTGGQSFGYSGDTASGARGTIGMGVGQASMSDVEAMLSSGAGRGRNFGSQPMPFHEINDIRREARNNGQTLAQFLGVIPKT